MNFLLDLHQDRVFRVRVGSVYSKDLPQENGICQGLSLSCTIFLIAINDIVSTFHKDVVGVAYADDVTLLMRSQNLNYIHTGLQLTLNRLGAWSSDSGFLFSPEKCQAIHFCRKRKPHISPNLTICDNQLIYVDNIKILGLIFDKKLTFKTHISQVKSDCSKRLNLLKVLSGTKWGCDKNSLLLLYRSLIRSKLDYGSMIYASAKSNLLKALESLDPIHNQGIRLSLGAFRSSPVLSMLSEAGEPPLSYRRSTLCANYLANTLRDSRHLHHNLIHDFRYRNSYEGKPRIEKPLRIRLLILLDENVINLSNLVVHKVTFHPSPWTQKMPTVNYELRKFDKKKDLHRQICQHSIELISQRFQNHTLFYTDASKTNLSVSAAFYSVEFTFKIGTSKSCYLYCQC